MTIFRMDIKFLMTCIGGALSKAVVQGLRSSEYFNYGVYGVDAKPVSEDAKEFFLNTAIVPSGNDEKYLNTILNLVEKWGIDVFWPASDDEVRVVSAHSQKFQALNCRVLAGSQDIISKLDDKSEIYDLLNAAGIYVPPYAVGVTEVEVWQAMQEFGYPYKTMVIKPTNGRGNRGLNIFTGEDPPAEWLGTGMREKRHQPNAVSSAEQLLGLLEKKTIIMPALQEPAYDVDVLGGKEMEAQVIVRMRMNPAGIPFKGNIIITDYAIQEYCKSIAAVLKLDSLFDMDLLTSSHGVCLLEINPRPSGSLAVSLFAGLPMLDAAVARLYDNRVDVGVPSFNIEVFSDVNSDNSLSLRF